MARIVKAKRLGHNERLTSQQLLDLDPYDREDDGLEGPLHVSHGQLPDGSPFTTFLVGGQPADPNTIIDLNDSIGTVPTEGLASRSGAYPSDDELDSEVALNAKPEPSRAQIEHSLVHSPIHSLKLNIGGHASTSYRLATKNGTEGIYKPIGNNIGDQFPIPPDTEHLREVAAHRIATHLGLQHLVPATTFRHAPTLLLRAVKRGLFSGGHFDIDKASPSARKMYLEQSPQEIGSIQHFVDNAVDPGAAPRHNMYGNSRPNLHLSAAFDYLTGNMDRHEGNWLVHPHIDSAGSTVHRIKLIDHGYILPSSYHDTYDERDEGFPSELRREAAYDRIPDLSVWQGKSHAIAADLRQLGIDEPAIERMQYRHQLLTSGQYRQFRHLPNFYQLAQHHGDF